MADQKDSQRRITCNALVLAHDLPCVQLAKWIAGKHKQPRTSHLLVLALCGRVIE